MDILPHYDCCRCAFFCGAFYMQQHLLPTCGAAFSYGQQGWLALLRRQTSSHILPGFDSRPFDMDTIRMLANYTLILAERNASCAALL